MDTGSLRRRDTTRGTPLRVLSLDGGGVRGYSMLILLHDFMHKVYTECHDGEPPEPDKIPKPCEYFDLIGGTGTGGLIAIMLGRLRMNTRDCMRVYVQMTRKVFETDKTIAGIPYRSTLFKASLLEEAIRACVRTFEHERGVEEFEDKDMPMTPASFDRPRSVMSSNGMERASTRASTTRHPTTYSSEAFAQLGDPNASLEDHRKERRCKTAVTAVLKGHSERSGTAVLLRSFPSRTQPAIEPGCSIWQAGRATCATKLAFKEIRIGTSTFLDEGYGLVNADKSPTYNPAPEMLEEAVLNEWPGQSIGLLLSIGTGRRPGGTQTRQQEWWEGFAGGLGNFAEAKRKLIAKIEGCEKTHQEMLTIHLPKHKVNPDNYLRLNVEVGVGEFGMNEWNRLADISNNTQAYLNTPSVRIMLNKGAMQMAKVEAMRRATAQKVQAANDRYAAANGRSEGRLSFEGQQQTPNSAYPPDPFAAELPSEEVQAAMAQPLSRPVPQYPGGRPMTYPSAPSRNDKYMLVSSDGDRTSTSEDIRDEYQASVGADAPPLPPKTPIQQFSQQQNLSHPRRYASHPVHSLPGPPHYGQHGQPPPGAGGGALPYPDNDGPPPAVNMARKPEFVNR